MPNSVDDEKERDRDRDRDRNRDRDRDRDRRKRSGDRFRSQSPEEVREGEPQRKTDQILKQLKTMTVSINKIPEDIKEATKAAEERANKHTNKEVGKVREELKIEVLHLFDTLDLHHRALERCLRTVKGNMVQLANWGGEDPESVRKEKIKDASD